MRQIKDATSPKLPQKEVKECYIENFVTLKEFEKDITKWIGKINTVKMIILPKTIYKFNAISVK